MATGSLAIRNALSGRPWAVPAAIAAVSASALLIALASQYWGGLLPCELCINQRWAHGAVIALGAAAAIGAVAGRYRFAAGFTLLAGLAALAGTGIALFHVGVEQHWWQGPSACTGSINAQASLEELRRQIEAAPMVRCDEVAFTLFGLSMAGMNVLLSAALAVAAIAGGVALLRRSR